jgi:mono/diheme cytochrome c family protein
MAKNKPVDEVFHHSFDGIQEFDNDLPGWWKWLFYISIAFAVVYMLHYHVFNTGDLSRAEYMKEMNPNYSATLDAASGGLLTPYQSPFLANEENLSPRVRAEIARMSDATFEQSVMRSMSKANAQQLEKLKSAFPDIYKTYSTGGFTAGGSAASNEPTIAAPLKDAASLAAGKQIFETQCFTCHGKLGEGLIGPNMCDEYWIHGGTLPDVIRTIRKGVPEKGMITWERTLNPDQINQVASFIMLKLQGTTPPNAKAPQGDKAVAAAPADEKPAATAPKDVSKKDAAKK